MGNESYRRLSRENGMKRSTVKDETIRQWRGFQNAS